MDELSSYMLASESRQLVKRLEGDLRAAGVPIEMYTSLGPDFWDDFVAIARRLLASAQGENSWIGSCR